MESTKTLPYVYLCINRLNGQFYIGYRSANKVPSSDDLGSVYFTSSHKVKESFSEFDYHIIAEFFQAEHAYEFEQALIHENLSNPLLLNKSCYHNHKPFFSSSEETRKKIGLKSKGRPTGMKNIPRPDSVKDKIRQGVLKTLDSRPKYEPSEDGLKPVSYTHLTLPTIYSV